MATETTGSSVLWWVLRLLVCAAALGYVLSRADLADTVWLQGRETPARVTAWHKDMVAVQVDGQMRTVPLGALQRDADGAIRQRLGMGTLWQRCDKRMVLLAAGCLGLHLLLAAVRFRWVLLSQEIGLGWLRTIAICWLGNFYSFVIPGTTGGDIVRVACLVRRRCKPHAAVIAVAMDRFTGLAGLFLLAALAGLLMPGQEPVVRRVAFASLALLIPMVIGLPVLAGRKPGLRLDRLPFGWHLQQMFEAVQASWAAWPILAGAVGLTLMLQAAAMTAYGIAAVALGMAPAWEHYFVCLPIALVVASVPVVPMGLGTLEAAMTVLLVPAVGSVSQVLGLAMLMRIMLLLWALPGGLVAVLWPTDRQEKPLAAQPCLTVLEERTEGC